MRTKALLAVVALAGCGGGSGTATGDSPGSVPDARPIDPPPPPGVDAAPADLDFAAAGPFSVSITSAEVSAPSSDLPYRLYRPEGATQAPLVVLGHGFSRGPEQMATLAEHMASHGVRVATPDYCNLSDHAANASDAAALATALADGLPVVHAGHSAGGLTAVLAAAQDPGTKAVLGLDLTDADSQAVMAAPDLGLPMLGLLGESSSCNASGNGAPVFEVASAWSAKVPGATHCDFENPTGLLCTFPCGEETGAFDVIRPIATAFVVWQLGVQPAGQSWASPDGARWKQLVQTGAIEAL